MSKEILIPENDFCRIHNIELSFISLLHENGFIDIITIDDTRYIHESQLRELEKIIRLHYDLDINLEGIDTIINLLNRINDLQNEIVRLRNNLRLYEPNEFW